MTSIEWVKNADGTQGETWNPLIAINDATGEQGHLCAKVGPDCANCYAEVFNLAGRFLGARLPYVNRSIAQAQLAIDERTLQKPLHWKRPRTVFPCSMTDLFWEAYTFDQIARVLEVIADQRCEQHTFLVLTKRPRRVNEFVGWALKNLSNCWLRYRLLSHGYLSNLWIGTSAGNQATLDQRWPYLAQQKLGVLTWLSLEPLIGAIDLVGIGGWPQWVVAGYESGPKARPTHPDIVRSIRDQCAAASVPFHFKQWGAWWPVSQGWTDGRHVGRPLCFVSRRGDVRLAASGYDPGAPCDRAPSDAAMIRIGKKRAGRLLDGRTHDDMPALAAATA